MKSFLYWGLVALLACAVLGLSILYHNVEDPWQPQNFLLSRDRQWILTGDQHLFEVTQRIFDLRGLDGFKEGSKKYAPVGSPRSRFYPTFVTPQTNKGIRADEFVLGILNGPVATAYPLRVIAEHQVINDDTQDPPVLVYFGETSRTAAGFAALSNGQALSMASTGFLYWGADLLFDVSTESLFLPVTATFVSGDRLGERLELLPSAVVTLAEWLALFPESRIMSQNTGFYAKRYPAFDIAAEPQGLKGSARYSSIMGPIPDAPVLTLQEGGQAFIVPLIETGGWRAVEYPVDLAGIGRIVHLTETAGGAYATEGSGRLVPSVRSRRPVCLMILPDAKTALSRRSGAPAE